MILALALAAATPAEPVVIPATGPALTAEIRARDAEFFQLFFEVAIRRGWRRCSPSISRCTMTATDWSRVPRHPSAQYEKACTARRAPDSWRIAGAG